MGSPENWETVPERKNSVTMELGSFLSSKRLEW